MSVEKVSQIGSKINILHLLLGKYVDLTLISEKQ